MTDASSSPSALEGLVVLDLSRRLNLVGGDAIHREIELHAFSTGFGYNLQRYVEAQIAIGLCLLLNRWPRRALWAGVVLNVCFTLAGSVNPSAFYLVFELGLLSGLSRPVYMTIAWRRAMRWRMGSSGK